MKLTYLKETTNYNAGYRVPLHTYIMCGSKCIGYIKEGTEESTFFKKPSVQFSKKNRTFKEVRI